MALSAAHRQTEQALGSVIHRVANPLFTAVGVSVSHEEARGTEIRRIKRQQFIRRQHLGDHLSVALVGVQRLHDPVAKMPHVFLAESRRPMKSVPVAVPPHIHPVPPPPLAVMRARQ